MLKIILYPYFCSAMSLFGDQNDTIFALSTAQGMGAIAMIRVSGTHAISEVDKHFSRDLSKIEPNKAVFGVFSNQDGPLDEVVITVFKAPHSFTGQDIVEIACHGSVYIQKEILRTLSSENTRMAGPGEFSLRAFFNGKMDLSQTEAIADLIASNSKAAHKVAMHQMRGGFSSEIGELRQGLMDFASLVELELDFSQEDVEFADRDQLNKLVIEVREKVSSLVKSFQFGNTIKNGIPVAIVGAPNAGKSTLLNALLNEEKAIVSDIAGTTRDVIEDTLNIGGNLFRIIDTAGIRETTDKIESIGVERAYDQIRKAEIIMLLLDAANSGLNQMQKQINKIKSITDAKSQLLIVVFNKIDEVKGDLSVLQQMGIVISAKNNSGIDDLTQSLLKAVPEINLDNQSIVTNERHYDILKKCQLSLNKVEDGLNMGIPGDLLAMDIRETIHLLGEITGEISSDDLLGNIFANFCIGK